MLAFTVRYLSEVFAFISAIIFKIPFNFLEFLLFQIKKKGGGEGANRPIHTTRLLLKSASRRWHLASSLQFSLSAFSFYVP